MLQKIYMKNVNITEATKSRPGSMEISIASQQERYRCQAISVFCCEPSGNCILFSWIKSPCINTQSTVTQSTVIQSNVNQSIIVCNFAKCGIITNDNVYFLTLLYIAVWEMFLAQLATFFFQLKNKSIIIIIYC